MGRKSMLHSIITLYLVWCISHSNSWSTLLVLNQSFIENGTKLQIQLLSSENKIYRSLARGLHELLHGITLELQILWFAIS
jgi:hypothetical protein